MAFVALFDTATIYGQLQRDLILRAAERDLFQPAWSEDIVGELERTLSDKGYEPGRMIGELRLCFPSAWVDRYEDLITAMPVDPDDRHVAAAAVKAGAGVIVTPNLRDFPRDPLRRWDIDVQTPGEFLQHLWFLRPDIMSAILEEMAADYTRPPVTRDEILDHLITTAPEFVAVVRGEA